MKTNQFKNLTAAFLLMMGALSAAAQSSEDRTVDAFTGVNLTGALDAELRQGPTAVHVEAPSNQISQIKTIVENGILQVSGPAKDDVKIIITSPTFTSLNVTGSSTLKSSGTISGDKLTLELSGASDMELALDYKSVDATATGASDLKLNGKAGDFKAVASGASDIKAYGFEADNVKAEASGSSDVRVNAKSSLDANASGASDIRYLGSPATKTVNASGTSSISEKDGSGSSDTTRVGMGKKHYTIITDDKDDDDDNSKGDKHYSEDFKFWSGLDLHVNALVDINNSTDPPSGYNFLELNYPRSIGVSWNIVQKNIHVYKNYVNIVTGLGLDWSIYGFRNNVTLRHDTNWVAATTDTIDYKRNRLRAMYVQAPIMIEFNTNPDANRSFHIGAGVLLGYNIFDNKLKQKYELGGQDHKNIVRDDFNVNPVRYGLTARVGYGDYSLFANYNLSTFFEKDRGPKMYPVQAGVHIDF